ncbi:hypothetical protein KC19_6G203700 [Ceratodon purpureus]|uniref:Secreted protein n=1 Tax=Ceratodon purpureus TaxID=3225 RepID=A0A8T0HJM7_CERPU|nr:hypothetical protein KC19_6G203700 [Ceratodon purpureus]
MNILKAEWLICFICDTSLAFDAFAGSGLKAGSNMNVKGRVTTTKTHDVLSTPSNPDQLSMITLLNHLEQQCYYWYYYD